MSSESKNTILLNYKIIKIIGKGNFSIVKLAIEKETGEKIAIKILDKNKIKNKHDMERIERELSMVKNIEHQNIAKVFDIKEDESKYYIIMEYCEKGELFNIILLKRKLTEEESAYYYYQIINGLEYIHLNNIIHRDLKPENLLLTKNNILKIIDFGLSNYNTDNNLLSTPCGSPCYASPEMVSGEKYNGFTSDIWSTGIILYAMINGYLPFENINNDNDLLFQKIRECKVDYPRTSSSLALDLLKKILVPDPNKRIKIEDIKNHNFYKKGKSIFYHNHKHKNKNKELDRNTEFNQENKCKCNCKIDIINRENNSKEKKTEKYNNIKSYESEQCNYNDIIDSKENQELINNNYFNKRYRNKEKKNNEIIKKISTNKSKKEKKVVINDEYFSNVKMKDIRKTTTTYLFKKNDEEFILNDVNKNTTKVTKDNFIMIQPIKIIKKSNNKSLKLQKEKQDKSKILRKSSYQNKVILTRKVLGSDKSKKIIELIPTFKNRSEINNQVIMKNDFSDNYPLKDLSIEHENEYYCNPLSQLENTSPINAHITLNLEDDYANDNNNKTKEKSEDIIIHTENQRINTDNYGSNGKIRKIRYKKSDINKKYYIIDGKKYSISVKKINNSEKKNKLLSKLKKNKKEKKEEYKNDERYSCDNRKIIKGNKTFYIKKYSNYIINPKTKETRPISIINYKPNGFFMINTPYKKQLNFEFFEKNKNKSVNNNVNENINFNSDIKNNDKNHSYLNDNQTNEDKYKYINDSPDIKGKENKKQSRKNIHRNKYTSYNAKIEVNGVNINNNIYTGNHSNEQSNNIDLSKETKYYYKNDNFNKNKTNMKYKDYKSTETIHKKGLIKYIINNNCVNNNYIEIISNSKKDISSKNIKKRLCYSAYDESCVNSQNDKNDNKENIIDDTRRIKLDKKTRPKEQEEIIKSKEKEKNKYYTNNNNNMRFTIKKIYNKLSENDIMQLNSTNKALNIKKYLNHNINQKKNKIFKSERSEKSINIQNETYIHRNKNENSISKKLFGKKKNSYKTKIIKEKNNENNEKDNSDDKENNYSKIKNKLTTTIITNISKMNISNFPSITIDMNILNKNNQKYLKLYDAIKNKL